MNEALFSRRDALRRGGFTLIEVVIALAIFLFGALAIVRIFPPALGIIQNSGDRLTALNLNRTTLARYAKNSSALPYAIYNVNSATLPFQPANFAGSTVGSALRNNSIPRSNIQTITDSALNQFKLVSGEKQIVRSVGSGATQTFYVLTSFPIAGDYSVVGVRPPIARIYKERYLTGVVAKTKTTIGLSKSGYLDFSNASSDPYSSPFVLPTASNDLTYYVSYNYFENGVLNATNDEAVRSNTDNSPNLSVPYLKIDLTVPNPTSPDSTVQVLQGRRLVTPVVSTNPPNGVVDGPVRVRYRQPYPAGTISVEPVDTLATTPNIKRQDVRNNLGILILTGVTVGEEISIDYQVNDWRQLVSNTMPSVTPETTPDRGPNPTPTNPGTPRDVVLPLHFLADGKDGSPTSIYSLLNYLNTDATNTLSLQANAIDTDNVLSNPAFFTLWAANRKSGRVSFDINDHATSPQDYTVLQSRIVYQTIDNWTHQLSVAPKNYTPYVGVFINTAAGQNADTTLPEPWRYYYWDKSIQPGRIFFPPSEAGKTISLSYSYAGGKVNDAVVNIKDSWIRDTAAPSAASPLAATDGNGNKWLAYVEPQLSAGGAAISLNSITAIKGISVQARTAWLDGDKFNQVSTVGFRGASN